MKKTYGLLVSTILVAIVVTLSCKKTKNTTAAPVYDVSGLNSLFAGLRYTPQIYVVYAGTDNFVYAVDSTLLHFYPNSFKDASGAIITSGVVTIQIIEMYTPGDMIRNRATTMVGGQILQSCGQINMVATMNGQEVFANKYGVVFKKSTSSTAPMALFYGATTNADSVTTWTQSDTTQNGTIAFGTTTTTINGIFGGTWSSATVGGYYFDSSSNFTWANCDWFVNSDSPKVSVSVNFHDTSFNASNTQLYLVLPNSNSDWLPGWIGTAVISNVEIGLGGSSYTASTNTMTLISEWNTAIVPAGLNYELVLITNKNGQYYYWSTAGIVPHNGINLYAPMALISQSDLEAKLNNL